MTDKLEQKTDRRVSKGSFYPLGASLTPEGVNFALYSQNADEVFLLLFDMDGSGPTDIIRLENRTKYIWHCLVHGLKAGRMYGYKVRGAFNPSRGMRFNENKLLLDPYAKAVTGKVRNVDNLLLAYNSESPSRDLSMDLRDSSAVMPKCIVINDDFDWQGDSPSLIPFEELIIYETHLKGFTAHPSSKVSSPGTYKGFIEKISHLKKLGVNAVEFLPLQEFYIDDFLLNKGLTNYWGYNTIGFFAPESSYSTRQYPGCQVNEFKTLVRELHKAGIEVILDVVYNHTGEGNELGPTICFRGIDNPAYYSLTGPSPDPGRYYMNYTGCGNSVNFGSSNVIRLVLDSLRYWVEVMHVDGFRFDLASVLGRDEGNFRNSGCFFDAIAQDPLLTRVKLIAEPWDLGTYQVGNFPVDWSEWNGRFRDCARKFIKGDSGQLGEMGARLTGSADLYGEDGRSPYNSINFITCHDGFTLNDLVSYNCKHNESNLENNCDGTNDNNSWNCGCEGASDDPAVVSLRKQMIKNFCLLLLFSAGSPMILGGDEFMRSQKGNNNAYCQDNPLSWFDWDEMEKNGDILSFFRKTIAFTRKYTALQSRKFLCGIDCNNNHTPDISWFGLQGGAPAWDDPDARTVCLMLDGSEKNQEEDGDYLIFIIFNCDYRSQYVTLPVVQGRKWRMVIDTSLPAGRDFPEAGGELPVDPPELYIVNPRSTVLLLGR
jgi:isoamylase